ncbi:hypothetical protein [Paenibacillus alvei]|uniref:hypothetical protein n=1 Tax=Paenibacillus alvei TaxID=44250 RepID=UPI00228132BC|nr:hypothetical protein [Paenibacillus alvei]
MNKRQEWLDSLQVGDEVIVSSPYRKSIANIERITPTRRIVVGNITFNSSGMEMAASWSPHSIWEVTPEKREEIHRAAMIGKLTSQTKWYTCTTEQLETVLSILEGDSKND